MRQLHVFVVVAITSVPVIHLSAQMPLDTYVVKPDESFTFELLDVNVDNGFTVYDLSMTSQKWRSGSRNW